MPRSRAPAPGEGDADRDGRERDERESRGHRVRAHRALREPVRPPADVERDAADERAALSAPSPANAAWPSDSCPAQPVSTVTDTAMIAVARISAYACWCADWVITNGTTIATTSAMPRGEVRHAPHPPHLAQALGHGGTRGANEKLSALDRVGAADARDEDQHDEEQHELDQARRVREVVEEYLVRARRRRSRRRRCAGTTSCRRSGPRSAPAAASPGRPARDRSCHPASRRARG